MIEFFNAKMQEAKLNTAPGNPVIAAQINLEQNFAFIEVCIIMEKVHDVRTMQGAKKVVSDSPGLVNFAIGLVNSVLNLPDGQAKIFRRIKITKVL